MSIYNNDDAAKQAEEELNAILEAQEKGTKDEPKDAPKGQQGNENLDEDDDAEGEDEEADDNKSKEDLGDDTKKSEDDEDLDEDGDGLSDDDKSKTDDDDDGEHLKRREKDGDKLIPKWQAKAEIKRIEKQLKEEMDARIQEAIQKATGNKSTDVEESPEVKEFVKKFGLKENGPEFIKEFGALIAKQQGLDDLKRQQEEQRKEALRIQAENEGFEKEWGSVQSTTLPKFYPNATDKEIAHIKKKVHELAYTPEYSRYKLDHIIRLNKNLILGEKRKSFESHKPLGKQSGMKSFDLDNPNSIPWSELSPQEFEKVSEALAARSPSSVRVTRKNGLRNK